MSAPTHITDIHGEAIDPVWQAEFRGFFWGEGTIAVNRSREGYSFACVASIGLRSDDAAILQEFQRRLGGRIRTENYRDGSKKTITRWVVGVAADARRVGHLLAGGKTGLLFNKKRQLNIWRAAVEVKFQRQAHAGTRYLEEERKYLIWAHEELKRLRQWVSNN